MIIIITTITFIIRFYVVQAQSYTGILAGGNGCGWSGDRSPASLAQLNRPSGVWGDTAGNIYFSESPGNRVRVVNSVGIIHTLVGTGNSSSSGARFLVGDTVSNLYISESYFTWRYSLSTLQNITIIGDSGNDSSGGDSGLAFSTGVSEVRGLAFSTLGTLYAAD